MYLLAAPMIAVLLSMMAVSSAQEVMSSSSKEDDARPEKFSSSGPAAKTIAVYIFIIKHVSKN